MDPDTQQRAVPGDDCASLAQGLLREQQEAWPLLRAGYRSLGTVESRLMEFDRTAIRVEWNPGRLTSSSAEVDDKSIRARRCFLCPDNLPAEQRAIRLHEDYLLLCNPFPIFREHFTISRITHVPQRIEGSFGTMLDVAGDLGARYTVIYNGPRCGASAPDHMHFQAGEKGFMPIEGELLKSGFDRKTLTEDQGHRVLSVDDGLRRYFVLEGKERERIVSSFGLLLDALARTEGGVQEPMVNIIAMHGARQWTVIVFPRAQHRPSFFFAQGEARILLSPAAVDCGGVCITPVERDFRRLTKENIALMFREVMLERGAFESVCRNL